MKRRSFCALISSLSVAAAALAGCSGDGQNDTQSNTSAPGSAVELTYWLWQDDATDSTWNDLADEFNKSQSDIQVNIESIPLDQYQNQLISAAMSDAGPDAARAKDWWLGQLAPEGALADMTDCVNNWDGREDVVDSLWATGQLPGEDKIYMLPHQYTTLYLYYRKDLFEAAGLAAPTTQAEFLDAAKALTKDGTYGIDVRGGAGGQDQWLAWMFAGGADVVDQDGNVVLDDAKGIDVNNDYLSIVTELKAAPPGSITAAFADVKKNFADGLTAMMIHHPGSLEEMQAQFGEDLGVIAIPTGDGQPGATLGTMSGNVVMASSDKQDAACKWVTWLSDSEQVARMSASPQGQLPVVQSVIDMPEYNDDPQLKVAVDAIATAKTWPALNGVAELAAKEWNPLIQQGFQGEISSEEVMKSMADVLR